MTAIRIGLHLHPSDRYGFAKVQDDALAWQ